MSKYLSSDKPKLLYVDDERPNLVAFRALLRDTYDVLIAENAEQAFDLLESNDVPLVVSDQRMPGMTGTQLLEKVARNYPDCARMILTGYADIEAVINAINQGQIYYYFKKPWNESEVRLTLSNALEAVTIHRELIESERRFRGAFEQAGLGIAHLEMQGKIIRANSRLCNFLGVSVDELVGSWIGNWFPELQQSELDSLAGGQTLSLVREYTVTLAYGKRSIRVTFSISLDRKGKPDYLIALVDDLTERLQLEEQLRQSQKLEAIGSLAGGVAHDFNNLLTPIMGYAYMIEKKLPQDDPLRERAKGITKAAMSARALTSRLLSFSRKQDLELSSQELNSVITSFYDVLRRTIRENIEISLNLDSQIVLIRADKWQLEQVFLNLAVNAQDAICGNGVITIGTAHSEIHQQSGCLLPEMPPGRYALLTFSDSGAGMSPETLEHIFEPFFTTKKVGHGTGLGLATVYGIVKQHGGFLDVSTVLGGGTTFRIYLPILTEMPQEKRELCEPVCRDDSGNGTILVVDDNEMVCEVVSEILKSAGYEVLVAMLPNQALRLAGDAGLRIDLLISDMVMPEMDGAELYRRIVANGRNLPAIFISGYSRSDNPLFAALDQRLNILPKPFSSELLLRTVQESIRGGG